MAEEIENTEEELDETSQTDQKTLAGFGMSREDVLGGDQPEYTPVKPKLRDKRQFYEAATVDKITKATFHDLREAYKENDRLLKEHQDIQEQLTQANSELNKAQQSVDKLSTVSTTSADKLKTALKQVSDYTQQISTVTKSLTQLQEKGAKMRQEIKDLKAKYRDVQKAKGDVDSQLTEFKQKLDAADQTNQDLNEAQDELAGTVNSMINAFAERYQNVLSEVMSADDEIKQEQEGSEDDDSNAQDQE